VSGIVSFGMRKVAVGLALLFTLASVAFWVNYAIPQDAGLFLLSSSSSPGRS
jgi:hypothetical protein